MQQNQVLGEFNIRQQYDNIITQTIKMTKNMTNQQQFEKARAHIMDALQNRQPRNTANAPLLPPLYYALYWLQTFALWDWLLWIFSYTLMWFEGLGTQEYALKLGLEGTILGFFIFDCFIDFYCRSFDSLKQKNRYPAFYFWKAVLVGLLLVDLITFAAMPRPNQRPIRPFRIFRAFLPLTVDPELRKSLKALLSSYKDILVFIVYYSLIILGFAFVGSQVINYQRSFQDPKFPNHPGGFDEYASNFNNFGKMIMQMYVLGSYDNYPDNQTPAIQYSEGNYAFFIIFIFLNMFLFVLVPGTIIYNKFRESRSKYILVEQIRQQHSLILAFVTLSQDEHNLAMETLIKFLFFFYREKVRYVEYITEICLKLDDNNNQTIQVNEFMQLSKLILYNTVLYPPAFDDLSTWLSFREQANQLLHIKSIVTHWIFDLIMAVATILAASNAFILLYYPQEPSRIIDVVFVWVFVVEILMRMIGVGPQTHFSERWNMVDAFFVVISAALLWVGIKHEYTNILLIARIMRIVGVFRKALQTRFLKKKIRLIQQIRRLFATLLEIMPIIVRFFFLYAFIFYIFSIIGMQIFYDAEIDPPSNPYKQYRQFSSFRTLLQSHYMLVQILVQASWSTLAYDYCARNPSLYAAIALFFVLMHFILVTVTATLIKGIFWEIYFTVGQMMDQIQQNASNQALKQEMNQIKTMEISEINQQINHNEELEPNTLIRRQIIEKKMDQQILRRIKNFQFSDEEQPEGSSQRSISRGKIVQKLMQSWNISANQLEGGVGFPRRKNSITSPKLISPKLKRKRAFEFRDLQNKQQADFQQQIQQLLNRLILSSKMRYSQIIAYPKVFVDYLNRKFKLPSEFNANPSPKFDINVNQFHSQSSVSFHLNQLHSVLGIQGSPLQKKQAILQKLTKLGLIDEQMQQKIFNNKLIIRKFHIDTNGALRKMYLSETNQDLVRKLEVQYFSDVYGNTFREINKVTLQPLLKQQAQLTYLLWNTLSYSQIDSDDFFHFLTQMQDQMSNQLLKLGSLVKFVYKINHQSDVWFQIQHKLRQDTQIRFIKTGVWAYTQDMQQHQIYYSRDVFNLDYERDHSPEAELCQQYIKLFYQSFETLGFSLINKQSFFESNPKHHVYDLFLNTFDIGASQRRSRSNSLTVSKIMLVILAKQEERTDVGERDLSYDVSAIQSRKKRVKRQDFILDEDQTFEKLKNLSAINRQKIIQSQGLPFSYILNLMKQIQDTLRLHTANFVHHIQKTLNSQYNSIDNTSLQDDDMDEIISLPQIVVNIDD